MVHDVRMTGHVTIAGTLPGAAGATAILTPGAWLADAIGTQLIPPLPVKATLDANGTLGAGISVMPSDAIGPYPPGVPWQILIGDIPGADNLAFSALIHADDGPRQDISDLARIALGAGGGPYLLPVIHDQAGRAVLDESGVPLT